MRRFLFLIAVLAFTACTAVTPPPPPTQMPDLKDREIDLLKRRLELANGQLREQTVARIVYQTQIQDAAIHGLKVGEPLSFAALTPAVLDRLFDESLKKQYPGSDFEHYNWVFSLFGAIPEHLNVRVFLRELMGEQAGGIYDPLSKKLYVSPQFDVTGLLGRTILAHEIGHSLQDRNFDLEKQGISESGNGDRSTALLTTVEGDATLLMGEVVTNNANPLGMLSEMPKMLMMDQQKIESAPPAIRDSLLFPYLQGMMFYQTLAGRTRHHPNGIAGYVFNPAWRNEILSDPPISTEQTLHPEKYLAGEGPAAIARMKSGPEDLAQTTYEVLGEFGIRLLLSATLDAARAEQAAAGWNGDRILVTGDGSGTRHTLHWITRWDTPPDADQFQSALADALTVHFKDAGLKWKAREKGRAADFAGHRLAIRRTAPDTVALDAVVLEPKAAQ